MSSSEEAEFDGGFEEKEEEEKEEEVEEPPPKSDPKNSRRTSRGSAPASYADAGGDDDDDDASEDDDVPLSSLVKKKPPASPKRKKAPRKAAPAASPKKAKSSKKYEYPSFALYGTESTKGLLIQRLLCRWWYAMEWPTGLPAAPPPHYDTLDGFPGVYVCTSPDGPEPVGHLLDVRDPSKAPSFAVFAKKDASELQTLLETALIEQMKVLKEHEGPGTATEKELGQLLKWTRKVQPEKADREAAKVLKAHGLVLP